MARIRLLSADLINKIAAGEVVERPASVVKELCENSIDAQARTVRVRLSAGGLSSISISDDGHGMSHDDARLSLERHATSKLPDDDTLFHITTKGFRGEALPTIAAVSRFTLTTSEPGAATGTKIVIDGGGEPFLEIAAPLGGTRIDVDDLFFNTPARRKFLKRESTELAHCQEAVIRLALAHPEVAFFLEHEGRQLFASAAAEQDPKERVIASIGAEVAPHLFAIEERRLGVSVTGFVASPEFTLPNARGLWTFVNRRYIRDRGLISAVQRSFQDSLPPGRQPVAVILIEVDPRAVDVNVHPQKLEVRFADPRSVQETVAAAITRALKAAPWRTDSSAPVPADASAHYALAVDRFLARAQALPFALEGAPVISGERPSFGTAHTDLNDAPPEGYFSSLRFLGEAGGRVWVCEGQGGSVVLLDPKAARERLVLDALAAGLKSKTLSLSRPTLFTQKLEVDPVVAQRLSGAAEALLPLGVELESFGGGSLLVRRVPEACEQAELPAFIEALSQWLDSGAEPQTALPLLAAACATSAPSRPTHDEVRKLFAQLDDADFSITAKHQRVILRTLPLLELLPG